jgi:hypothetical protein
MGRRSDPENSTQRATAELNRFLLRDPTGPARHDWTGLQQRVRETLLGFEAEFAAGKPLDAVWDPQREMEIVLATYLGERSARR